MLKYVENILNAVIKCGIQESKNTAHLILKDLTSIRFDALRRGLDSIVSMEQLVGNPYLAKAIVEAFNNMGKIYSVSEVEYPEEEEDYYYLDEEEEGTWEDYLDTKDVLDEEFQFEDLWDEEDYYYRDKEEGTWKTFKSLEELKAYLDTKGIIDEEFQ
jgi:hypothetical protein